MERSLKAHQYKAMYNPYSPHRNGKGPKERFPVPHHLKSDFWDPTPLQAAINKEVEEKFHKENFQVNGEMRDEILVSKSHFRV